MRSFRASVAVAVLVLLGLALPGCSSSKPRKITGVVRLNDAPLGGAHVRFVPKDDLSLGEIGGRTGPDGKFTIIAGGPGGVIKPGRFVVLITKDESVGVPSVPKTKEELEKAMKGTAPGVSSGTLPEIYADKERSPFEVEIKAGTTALPPFELKSELKSEP
jgi:hypothetical protein